MAAMAIPIPLPTDRTLEGPRISYDKDGLVVAYDYENDDGSRRWAEIVFTEPLFYQFADNSCDEVDDILSSKEIRRQDASELLASVLSRWNERYGWQESQQQKGGSSRFAHFTVFFDDAGSVDVVASGCDVALR